MTVERQDILEDFYQGNTKKLRIHVVDDDGGPKDLTDAEVTLALFLDKTEIVYLTKCSWLSDPFGTYEITIEEPLIDGNITVHINPPDTHNLYGTYRYHVNVIDEDGYEETVTTGRINIFKAFAKRPGIATLPVYLTA